MNGKTFSIASNIPISQANVKQNPFFKKEKHIHSDVLFYGGAGGI